MMLIDPYFGLYTWAPLLALSLVPTWRYPPESLVLPRFERRWLVATWIAFLLFSSANQYSRLQFNSGFRYLIPLVPFLMLALADHWRRLGRPWQIGITMCVVLHSWVLTVFRESAGKSWRMLLSEGPQLPWYRVLSLTSRPDNPWLGNWWVPSVVIAVTLGMAALIWQVGARAERRENAYGIS